MGADHPVTIFDAYWRDLAGGGIPSRKSLRPENIRHVLRWMMIVERLGAEDDPLYIVRLHGTAASAMMHGNLTGRELSEEFTSGDCYTSRVAAFRASLDESRPVFGSSLIEAFGRPRITVGLGIFPFSGATSDHPQLVIIAAPDDLDLRRAL